MKKRTKNFIWAGYLLSGLSGVFIGVASGNSVRAGLTAGSIGACFSLAALGVECITRSPHSEIEHKSSLVLKSSKLKA